MLEFSCCKITLLIEGMFLCNHKSSTHTHTHPTFHREGSGYLAQKGNCEVQKSCETITAGCKMYIYILEAVLRLQFYFALHFWLPDSLLKKKELADNFISRVWYLFFTWTWRNRKTVKIFRTNRLCFAYCSTNYTLNARCIQQSPSAS